MGAPDRYQNATTTKVKYKKPMDLDDGDNKLRTPLLLQEVGNRPYLSLTLLLRRCFGFLIAHGNAIAILAGPLFALLLLLLLHIRGDNGRLAVPMLAVMAWVFTWWSTEAVPIAIASLVPLFAMPLLRIRGAEEVARSYANDTTFLVVASFIMAAAVQQHALHRRITLYILRSVGPHPRCLLLSFMFFAAALSMLIDNAPVAAMIIPLGVRLRQKLHAMELLTSTSMEQDRLAAINENFSKALIYGITYSVTMGGMATLTGNGANLVLPEIWQSLFPTAAPIKYVQWFLFAFPLTAAVVLFTWVMLCLWFCPSSGLHSLSASLHSMPLEEKIRSLGPMPFAEKSILAILLAYIVLLITKSEIGAFPGWGGLFSGYAGTGTVTVLMAALFFVIPDGKEPGRKLLDWQSCSTISWSTVLLLGGGFAMADGFKSTGLTDIIAENLEDLKNAPYFLITPAISLMTGILTEFTSNTSVTTLFLPTMAELAIASNRHPLWFMVPTTIGSQFSFMLPVATASNAIAYSTGHISIREMAMVGIPVKLIGVILLSTLMPSLGTRIFNNKY